MSIRAIYSSIYNLVTKVEQAKVQNTNSFYNCGYYGYHFKMADIALLRCFFVKWQQRYLKHRYSQTFLILRACFPYQYAHNVMGTCKNVLRFSPSPFVTIIQIISKRIYVSWQLAIATRTKHPKSTYAQK